MQYHPQPYYYPYRIKEDSYTLTGTCLKARNFDKSGKGAYWVQPAYEWGYVDNFSPIDHYLVFQVMDMANLFGLDNATDFEENEVKLAHIDFANVVTGLNAKSGWLGELSTEICGMYDY